jgi:hypothetical protein
VVELVDRPAVQLARGHELVAGLHQGVHDEELRRVARGDPERRRPALERRDPLLEHRDGRVADARIDVAEGLQPEQRGGMVHVVEHERGGLIDRRRPRPRGGIRRRTRMDGQRVETRSTIRHDSGSFGLYIGTRCSE